MLIVKVLFSFFFIFISFNLFANRSRLAALGREGVNELWLLAVRSVERPKVVGAVWVSKYLDVSIVFLEVELVVKMTAVALFFLFNLCSSTCISIHFAFYYVYISSSWVGTTNDSGLHIGALA